MKVVSTALLLASLVPVLSAQDVHYVDPRLASVRRVFLDDHDDLNNARPVMICFAEHLTRNLPLTLVPTAAEADTVLVFIGGPPISTVVIAYLPTDVLGWKLWTGVFQMNPRYSGPDASCQIADKLSADLREGMRRAKNGQ